MPLSKEASIRYKIIDSLIANRQRPFPSMDYLLEQLESKLGKTFSVSTIQKDIRDMKFDEELGFHAPIKFSKQRNGYYYSDPDYTIQKLSLQEVDVEALKVAADLLNNYSLGSRVSHQFSGAVRKIMAAVQEKFPENDKVRSIIQLDYTPNQKGLDHFDLLLQAARERIPLCFVHYSYKRRDFQSVILHPMLLKEFQNNWYLVGYSENHKELRTFGLDRIYDPKLLKRKYLVEKEKGLDEYFNNVVGVYPLPGEKKQRIEFSVDPLISDHLNAHPVHSSQRRIRETDSGWGIFTLDVIPSVELLQFFLSQAPELVVLKPKWLKERISELHKEALANEKYRLY